MCVKQKELLSSEVKMKVQLSIPPCDPSCKWCSFNLGRGIASIRAKITPIAPAVSVIAIRCCLFYSVLLLSYLSFSLLLSLLAFFSLFLSSSSSSSPPAEESARVWQPHSLSCAWFFSTFFVAHFSSEEPTLMAVRMRGSSTRNGQ